MNTRFSTITLLALLAAAPAAFSQANNALDFDGMDDYIEAVANNPNLPQGNDPRTIEAWINPSVDRPMTIYNWGGSENNKRFGLLLVNRRIYVVTNYNDFAGGTSINLGAWSHIAVTYDGLVPKAYVNGHEEPLSQLYFPSPFQTTGTNWRLGTASGYTPMYEPFQGLMDEVKVWMYPRGLAHVRFDMVAESCKTPGMVAYFDFNQGRAGLDNTAITSLTDRSASAKHGTLVNFTRSGNLSNFVKGMNICRRTGSTVGAYNACVASAALAFGPLESPAITRLAGTSACSK